MNKEYRHRENVNGDRIEVMKMYKEYILSQMANCEDEQKYNAWQNALDGIERQIENFENEEKNDRQDI